MAPALPVALVTAGASTAAAVVAREQRNLGRLVVLLDTVLSPSADEVLQDEGISWSQGSPSDVASVERALFDAEQRGELRSVVHVDLEPDPSLRSPQHWHLPLHQVRLAARRWSGTAALVRAGAERLVCNDVRDGSRGEIVHVAEAFGAPGFVFALGLELAPLAIAVRHQDPPDVRRTPYTAFIQPRATGQARPTAKEIR